MFAYSLSGNDKLFSVALRLTGLEDQAAREHQMGHKHTEEIKAITAVLQHKEKEYAQQLQVATETANRIKADLLVRSHKHGSSLQTLACNCGRRVQIGSQLADWRFIPSDKAARKASMYLYALVSTCTG